MSTAKSEGQRVKGLSKGPGRLRYGSAKDCINPREHALIWFAAHARYARILLLRARFSSEVERQSLLKDAREEALLAREAYAGIKAMESGVAA